MLKIKMDTMLLLVVITSLNLVVRAQGERCESDGLGFRCEDNGDCWEKVALVNICEKPTVLISRNLFVMAMNSVKTDRTREKKR